MLRKQRDEKRRGAYSHFDIKSEEVETSRFALQIPENGVP